MASRLLGVPVSLVALVDADRQFFKSEVGLPDPWASARQTPLSHSFCKYVVASQAPLIVCDARTDARVSENVAIEDIGVIAYAGIPLTIASGDTLGSFCAIDRKPRVWAEEELALLADLAAMALSEIELHIAQNTLVEYAESLEHLVVERTESLREAAEHNRQMGLAALRSLAHAIDAKDTVTREHSDRVADLAGRFAIELGWTPEQAQLLADAALVHGIGKIAIPDAILFKPGRLTEAEYAIIQQHAALGASIVTGILLPEKVEWIRHHHERYDGRGYPDALAGERTPEGGRILAVADSFDVMTAARPYRKPMSTGTALTECARCSGTQFDPRVVTALRRILRRTGAGLLAA